MDGEHDVGEPHGRRVPRLPRAAYRDLDDASLIGAMRAGDDRGIGEFIVRHHRLLTNRARYWGQASRDVDDSLNDVIEDIAVGIVNGRIRPTRSLAAYVVKAFRSRLALVARTEAGRQHVEYDAAPDSAGIGERSVSGIVSEATRRASDGADCEPAPTSVAVKHLAHLIDRTLTDDDRRVLAWLSNYVSQRDICRWLGVSYAAGTQRIWRLRQRLRGAARAYAEAFPPAEQRELARFFRHTGDESHASRRDRSCRSKENDR